MLHFSTFLLFFSNCTFSKYLFSRSTYSFNFIFVGIVCIDKIHVFDKGFFLLRNHCYDNWNSVFFLFALQPLLENSFNSIMQLIRNCSWKVVAKVDPPLSWSVAIDKDADPSNGVRLHENFVFFVFTTIVIYLTPLHLFNVLFF